jgi:hypothetical protein
MQALNLPTREPDTQAIARTPSDERRRHVHHTASAMNEWQANATWQSAGQNSESNDDTSRERLPTRGDGFLVASSRHGSADLGDPRELQGMTANATASAAMKAHTREGARVHDADVYRATSEDDDAEEGVARNIRHSPTNKGLSALRHILTHDKGLVGQRAASTHLEQDRDTETGFRNRQDGSASSTERNKRDKKPPGRESALQYELLKLAQPYVADGEEEEEENEQEEGDGCTRDNEEDGRFLDMQTKVLDTMWSQQAYIDRIIESLDMECQDEKEAHVAAIHIQRVLVGDFCHLLVHRERRKVVQRDVSIFKFAHVLGLQSLLERATSHKHFDKSRSFGFHVPAAHYLSTTLV